jgi:peptidoglycan/LPS O-acetylase OafA/YrhL
LLPFIGGVVKKINAQNNFDVLRLILAVLVFFTHWNILTSQKITNLIFHLSGFAIDMFFIVSGFLIFWSFNSDQNKYNFFIKRFFRVFPLYAFLIILQALFFLGFSDGGLTEIVKYFLANIFFLNFLAPSVGTTLVGLEVDAINGSLWTLKNEVAFYALVPLIFMFYKKWGVYFLLMLYSLSVLYMFTVEYLEASK